MSNRNSTDLPYRRSVRLPTYDYQQPGFYFVTIGVAHKKWHFGEIINDVVSVNDTGRIVQSIWNTLPKRFPHIELDMSVIMPNHFHGLIVFGDPELFSPVVTFTAKIPTRFRKRMAKGSILNNQAATIDAKKVGAADEFPTLGEVVRTLKAAATFRIRKTIMPDFFWQRGFYEHIMRNDQDLARVREYIFNNPMKWAEDILMK
jgi:REP element-mobilizing transposase RayT